MGTTSGLLQAARPGLRPIACIGEIADASGRGREHRSAVWIRMRQAAAPPGTVLGIGTVYDLEDGVDWVNGWPCSRELLAARMGVEIEALDAMPAAELVAPRELMESRWHPAPSGYVGRAEAIVLATAEVRRQVKAGRAWDYGKRPEVLVSEATASKLLGWAEKRAEYGVQFVEVGNGRAYYPVDRVVAMLSDWRPAGRPRRVRS